VVSILVCDLVGSTLMADRQDPETFGRIVRSFRDTVHKSVQRHGGTLQQQPGDAVVAVFGIPELHEDDALRAVTAAAEFRAALVSLNDRLERSLAVRLEVRIGIDTGEVAVDDSAIALGDAVNVAARLQQAAAAGEILVGERTRQHVHRVATLEQVPRLLLKGKDMPVAAWRLLAVDPDPRDRGRRLDVPLVGRMHDLEALHSLYRRAVQERSCHVVIVLGEAGVGKTRLVNEFESQLSADATVLKGRCKEYGENLDYWPFLQVVREAAGIRFGDPPGVALGRLASLAQGDEVVAVRLAQMLGLREGTSSLETASWALGRLIGMLAASQPVVIVLDDLHWARATLLDFLEQVADRFRETPVLIVCMARTEFRYDRPRWGGASSNAVSFTLNPLDRPRMAELIGHLLDGGSLDEDLRGKLVQAARGNPLVAEELVAMFLDEGSLGVHGGRWELRREDLSELPTPPTIEALLAARLERLSPDERAVIGKAAVIGSRFQLSEVAALAEFPPSVEPSAIPEALQSLVRRELLRRDAVNAPGDDGYRFRHVLIRDAANQSVAKEARAKAHQRMAGWLEEAAAAEPARLDERIARHLKAACALHEELGHVDVETVELRQRAGEWLAAAGLRVARRGDAPGTAAQYLGDAVELLPSTHPKRLPAQLQLADARAQTALLRNQGRSPLNEVARLYTETIAAARKAGDHSVELRAELGLLEVDWFFDFGKLLTPERLEEMIQEFEWLRDDAGLAKAWHVRANVYAAVGRSNAGRRAAEHAVRLAERAHDVRMEARSRQLHCFILDWGPMPAYEVASRVEETLKWARRQGNPSVERDARNVLARAKAMGDDFDGARAEIKSVKQVARSSSEPLLWVADEMTEASVDLLAERFEDAERRLRRAYDDLTELGGQGPLANVAIMLARALLAQGRDDDAARLAEECRRIAPEKQLDAQIKHREIRAVVLARRAAALKARGEDKAAAEMVAQAEELARDAVELSERSEQLDSRAQACYSSVEVLARAGRWGEAESALARARELWTQKGNLVSARNAPKRLSELREAESA
jgi:class 3 adenylate cyclase/tetratricopeptide (TPR) repeat protein